MKPGTLATRLGEYISLVLPAAHGHQRKAVADFVAASLIFTPVGPSGSCRNRANEVNKATVEKSEVTAGRSEGLAAGVWGGQHIRLEVTGGGAQVEYDCARGTIDRPIVTDGDGKFDVKGTFTREHGGPVRSDEEIKSRPARYAGRVKNGAMTLTVTLTDTGEDAGTFTLARGSEGRLMKCR